MDIFKEAEMARDPAFLFYSSDFLTGTMFFSDEQIGKYIKLLCAQHQKGNLLEEDMLKICKTYDKDIFSKFIKSEDGSYYNKRLSEEIAKRSKYCESRRNNRLHKHMSNISETYVEHMENENENINVIELNNTNNSNTLKLELDVPSVQQAIPEENKREKNIFIIPTIEEIKEFTKENNINIDAENFFYC
jgi:uncharacterized protein YdaU (DUF1376 family)